MSSSGDEAKRASVAGIAAALSAADAEERRQATARLADLEVEEALPLLLRALGDEDWRVRKEATFVCHRLAQSDAPVSVDLPRISTRGEAAPKSRRGVVQILVSALLDALRSSEDVGLRNAVIDALGHAGRGATAALVQALDELDPDGRKLVVEALGRTRDPAALDALEGLLDGADDNLRHAAIESIAAMGLVARERVAVVLLRSLRHRDRFVQLTALHGLNAMEAPIAWPLLAPLIGDSMLRPTALTAAALAESPEAPAALVSALASARGSAFTQILRALTRLCEGQLAPKVAEALRAAPPEVCARLVHAAAVLPSLTRVMSEPPSWRGPGADPVSGRAQALMLAALARAPGAADAAVHAIAEPALAEPAQRALLMLGPHALPPVLAYLDRQLDPEPDLWEAVGDATAALIDAAVAIVRDSVRAEGEGGAPEIPWGPLLAALRKAVRSVSTLVATSALYGLARVGVAADLPLAAGQTRAASVPVARAAESALSALSERYPEAARELGRRMMLHDETHLPAAIAFGVLGAAEQDEIAFLTHAAGSGDVRVRRAAVTALASAGGAPSLDVLSLALADEEREVRVAAARALGRWSVFLERAGGSSGDVARARELLALLRTTGDPDLAAAAAHGEAFARAAGPSGSAADLPSDLTGGLGPPWWNLP